MDLIGAHQSSGEALIRHDGRWCDVPTLVVVVSTHPANTKYLKVINVNPLKILTSDIFILTWLNLPAIRASSFYPSCWPMKKAWIFIENSHICMV